MASILTFWALLLLCLPVFIYCVAEVVAWCLEELNDHIYFLKCEPHHGAEKYRAR